MAWAMTASLSSSTDTLGSDKLGTRMGGTLPDEAVGQWLHGAIAKRHVVINKRCTVHAQCP